VGAQRGVGDRLVALRSLVPAGPPGGVPCGGLLPPLAGATVVLATTRRSAPLADAASALLLLTIVARGVRSQRRHAGLCPVLAPFYAVAEGLAAVVAILGLELVTTRPELSPPALALLAAAVIAAGEPAAALLRALRREGDPVRVAWIGSPRGAAYLSRTADRAAPGRFTVVAKRTSAKNPEVGILTMLWEVFSDAGEKKMEITGVNLIKVRSP